MGFAYCNFSICIGKNNHHSSIQSKGIFEKSPLWTHKKTYEDFHSTMKVFLTKIDFLTD